MKELTVQADLEQKLKDPYFKELYELEQQKYHIVESIVEYRIKNNLSQTELADKVGISQQHISKVENGDFSSMSTVEKILLAIGKTIEIRTVDLSSDRKKKVIRAMRDRIKRSSSKLQNA